MKKCSTCNRAYEDETLRFCLDDGSRLSDYSDSEATRVISSQQVLNLPATEVWRYAPPPTHQAKPRTNMLMFGAIAFLALVVGGGLMWLLMRPANKADSIESQSRQGAGNSQATEQSKSGQSNSPGSQQVRAPLGIRATASSTRSTGSGITYHPANLLDQSSATAWDEGVSGPGIGEWVRCDFDSEVRLKRIIISPGYFKTPGIWKQNNRLAGATFYFSDGSSRRFTFSDRMTEQQLDVGSIRTSWVRMVIDDIYPGSADTEDTPISSLSFDWESL